MSSPPKDPTDFAPSSFDITPTELHPPGKLRDPKQTAADLDHAALLVVGQRLAVIEDRLGHIEMRLGNIEGILSQILTTLRK